LFLVEPLAARRILPWFGGSAAVWSTCLVFYQVALLAGYLYAQLCERYLPPRRQALVHIGMLAASLLLLPIGPGASWQPLTAPAHPAWSIFQMLTLTLGLPFLLLSATGPLVQSWLARSGSTTPYRMFAVSNLASFAALLAFPTLVEPLLGTNAQRLSWSCLYILFAALCGFVAWKSRDLPSLKRVQREQGTADTKAKLRWFALAACGSMLLLSITNHIDQNIAAVPLLWVLPLATYLLSFVFTFGSFNVYQRGIWTRLLAFALGILGYAIYNIDAVIAIQISVPIFLAGLFVCCVYCHGELNRLRPAAEDLTGFYLSIAAGGAAGAIFIGLLAPILFTGVYELPVTLTGTALLALALTWNERVWAIRLLWVGVAACMAVVTVTNRNAYGKDVLSMRRSFYGSLRTVQTPLIGPNQQRILFHGTIEHGAQFTQLPRRLHPTTYYGPDSGIGILLRECAPTPKRVAVVGLGAGTLAAYGEAGDDFHFYEINAQIADMASSLFTYLSESHAHTEITIGDGRLSLEQEKAPAFDVIALDAFSGDAIPVHLLTKEALAIYLRHLRKDGVVAFHVSNDFLNLAPVVKQLASNAGYGYVLIHNHADPDEELLASDWVLVTRNQDVLQNASVRTHQREIAGNGPSRLWTDDYNDLLSLFRTPSLGRSDRDGDPR
jgi:hypothetical protein